MHTKSSISFGFDSWKLFVFTFFEKFQIMLKVFNGIFKDSFWLIEWFHIDKVLVIQIHVLESVHDFGHFLLFVGLLLLFLVGRLLGLGVIEFVGVVGLFGFLFSSHGKINSNYYWWIIRLKQYKEWKIIIWIKGKYKIWE